MIDLLRKILFVIAVILIVAALIVEMAFDNGFGLKGLSLLEALLVFAVLLLVLSVLLPARIHGRIQGIITFIAAIFGLVFSFFCTIGSFVALMIMLSLIFAVPFGPLAYLAIFGHFARSDAAHVLAAGMLLKLFFSGFLVAAQVRYLQNKGLVFLVITSLIGTLIVSFLHAFVPGILVSITDAVAGIVLGILTFVWALWFLLKSLPGIGRVLMFWRSA
jgi:hypothetical protein